MKKISRVALIYLISLWGSVGVSNWVLARLAPDRFADIVVYRGFVFIFVTFVILNYVLVREKHRRDAIEGELRSLAIYDPLTGLLNRTCFVENLEKAVAQASRDDFCKVGVVFLDIDGFKTINDQFGHQVGDELLMEAGKRISQVVRAGDCAARFGGDEFVILVNCRRDGGTERLARRLVETLRKPFVIKGEELSITASVGFALFPDHGTEGEQLVRAADKAMYEVKATSKNAILEATV